MFVVNELTGEVVLGPGGFLDRERAAIYRLSIEARDHGVPVRSAVTTVTLNVLDVNDNRPQVCATQCNRLKMVPYTVFLIKSQSWAFCWNA